MKSNNYLVGDRWAEGKVADIDGIEVAIDLCERLSFKLGTTRILTPEWHEVEDKLVAAHKAAMALIKERLGLS